MSRFRHADILLEMIELCQDGMTEVRQQLAYHRASVYKIETAGLIDAKVEKLRILGGLFADEALQEAFTDYEVMAAAGILLPIPGECSFSKRVTCLLLALDQHLSRLNRQIANRLTPESDEGFSDAVKKNRRQLLELCRHGSHQWEFFQAL